MAKECNCGAMSITPAGERNASVIHANADKSTLIHTNSGESTVIHANSGKSTALWLATTLSHPSGGRRGVYLAVIFDLMGDVVKG